MTRVQCPTCRTDYAARKDGQPRGHGCDRITVAPETIVALPWCTPPLTQNQLRRLHPLAEARLKAAALSEARWAIRAARLEFRAGANVTLHWRMPDQRRRDGDGAAPTLKVVLDALVKEGVLQDDSWIEVPHSGVTCHPPMRGMAGSLWVELTDPPDGRAA